MGYTLTIITKVKCGERFEEVVKYAQESWTELNKTNPNWWELTINADECKLRWYSDSYKAYDVLNPVLEKMYQHFADIVFIDELIADSQHWGTYFIENGKSTRIRLNILSLDLKTEEDKANIVEFLTNGDNDAFCKAHDIEFRLLSSLAWIYPTEKEDIVKDYAKRIITQCHEIQCYFVISDYEDMFETPTQVCRRNGADYIWAPVDTSIQENWESILIYENEYGKEFDLINLFEPSEEFLKVLNGLQAKE